MIRPKACLQRSESGQVTILFVFASVVVIWLLAFVVNTPRQIGRKIEMQGAADAAAVASGVWAARGMNMMTMANKGMADLLSIMITVHALRESAEAMTKILPGVITALYAASVEVPPLALIAEQLQTELTTFYPGFIQAMRQTENALTEVSYGEEGWRLMRELDSLNQTIKVAVPAVVEISANLYAQKNGADRTPAAWVFSGFDDSLPGLPVGRGAKEFIARQAECCSLPELKNPARLAFEGWCSAVAGLCLSPVMAFPILDLSIQRNVEALATGVASRSQPGRVSPGDIKKVERRDGKSVEDIVDEQNDAIDEQNRASGEKGKKRPRVDLDGIIRRRAGGGALNFVLGPTMEWPSVNPPLPMVLTDNPDREGDSTVPDSTSEVDLIAVSRFLRYLAAAFGAQKPPLMGGRRFVDPAPYGWITYAQSEVYNPDEWNMFKQKWRTKLTRASLLDEKWHALADKIGAPRGPGRSALPLVNLH